MNIYKINLLCQIISLGFLLDISTLFVFVANVNSQVLPDQTLIKNTRINKSGKIITIRGGTQSGNNLFHSFNSFSLLKDEKLIFDSPPQLKNIFSRVTGNLPSKIDGSILSKGSATIFIINPKGIFFGPDANLSIGGSFFATTASRVLFKDTSFSTIPSEVSNSILSINGPVGLSFDSSVGTIKNLAKPNQTSILQKSTKGLEVSPEKMIALIGGKIIFDGGNINAPDGQIELTAVGMGSQVGLQLEGENSSVWSISVEKVDEFQDVIISNLGIINTSGLGGGKINVSGRSIILSGGAKIQSNTFGNKTGGEIRIKASENFDIVGNTSTDGPLEARLAADGVLVPQETALTTLSFGNAKASNIVIQAEQLRLEDGAEVTSLVLGNGAGGDILINASDSIELSGQSILLGIDPSKVPKPDSGTTDPNFINILIESTIVSLISTTTAGKGSSGDIDITTRELRVIDGSAISAGTLGTALGGEIIINAKDSILVTGTTNSNLVPSLISTTTSGDGNGKNVSLLSEKLSIQDGGMIATVAVGNGNAGNLIINISELLEVEGSKTPVLRSQLNSGSLSQGNAGKILVNANNLLISDEGLIQLSSFDQGLAGSLELEANAIVLNNSSNIVSNSVSQGGGDISIDSSFLLLKNMSNITTNSEGTGIGGNISINSTALLGSPIDGNSDITSNSENGSGGRIAINTPIFGFDLQNGAQLRENNQVPNQLQTNDISAFSRFNSVTDTGEIIFEDSNHIKNIEGNQAKIIDVSNLVSNECAHKNSSQKQVSSFSYIAKSSPISKADSIILNPNISTWAHVIPHSRQNHSLSLSEFDKSTHALNLVEAEEWHQLSDGRIVLVSSIENSSTSIANRFKYIC